MKIFGREPVVVIGLIQALLIMLLSFNALEDLGLKSQDDIMLLVGVLSTAAAIGIAWGTTRTLLAPVVEFFKALVAFGAIYGFALSTEQTGSIIAAITVLISFFHQSQVSPLAKGNFKLAA